MQAGNTNTCTTEPEDDYFGDNVGVMPLSKTDGTVPVQYI